MAANEEIIVNAILAGTREYLANAQTLAASNEEIAASSDLMGRSFETSSRRGLLMTQAVFTLRRMTYFTTLALLGGAAAALKWGWNFNSAMQQARVALGPLSHDLGGVQNELDYLFNFTKYTPFQFKDMTIAFRQMFFGFHALGLSAQFTNETLKAMVDNLSATGRTTPGALNRVSVALQHLANLGHLTGQAVLQLARDGIQIYPALHKELGLTADQMHNIAKANIPVSEAMQAIIKYTESTPGLMNAAHRIAIHTFSGLFTTFKDQMGQIMGAVEKGWFDRLQGFLNRTNNFFNGLQRTLGGHASFTGIIRALNQALTPGSNGILRFWTQIRADVHDFWLIFSTLVHELTHSTIVWGMVYVGLLAIHGVLAFLLPQTLALADIIKILIPLWSAWFIWQKLNAIWLGITSLEEAVLKKRTAELTFAQALYRLWLERTVIWERIAIGWTLAYAAVTDELGLSMVTLSAIYAALKIRVIELATTMYEWLIPAFIREAIAAAAAWIATLGPIAWIVAAVVALVAFIVVLYFKWHWFHELVNATGHAIEHGILWVWRELVRTIKEAYDWTKKIFGYFAHPIRGVKHLGTSLLHFAESPWTSLIPGLAGGGTVTSGGITLVGESGPELLSLPTGARVQPTSGPQSPVFNMPESWMQRPDRQPIILKIGERVIESIVVDLNTGRLARA